MAVRKCCTFRLQRKKSFIAHPWRLLCVVGLEEYSAHDWRAATSGTVRSSFLARVGPVARTMWVYTLSTIDTQESKLGVSLVLEVLAKLIVGENSSWEFPKVRLRLILEVRLILETGRYCSLALSHQYQIYQCAKSQLHLLPLYLVHQSDKYLTMQQESQNGANFITSWCCIILTH